MRRLLVCAFGLSVFCAVASATTVLDPPAFFATCPGSQYFGAGTYSCPGATVTVGSSPDPIARTITAGDNSAQATVAYYFEITGGNPGDTVPFDVSASLFTTAGGDLDSASGQSAIEVDAFSLTLNQSVSCGYVPGFPDTCLNPQWSGTLSGTTESGYVNTIHLSATSGSQGDANSSAMADPYIYIDPAFAATHQQYTLVVGADNPAPNASIPEPATLLSSAASLVALALRFRRQETVCRGIQSLNRFED
jgi:hypothetical protein